MQSRIQGGAERVIVRGGGGRTPTEKPAVFERVSACFFLGGGELQSGILGVLGVGTEPKTTSSRFVVLGLLKSCWKESAES